MICLKVIVSGKGKTLTFHQNRITLGRGKDNLLRIEDISSSRRHCTILWKGKSFVLQDLGSRNGTYLNGKKVDEVSLKRGDRITVGKTEIQVIRWKSLPEKEIRGEIPLVRSLLDINHALIAGYGLRKMLEIIMDNAIALTRAERGFVILYRGSRLHIAVARNFERGRIKNPKLEISRNLAEEVMERNEEVLTTDITGEEKYQAFESVARLGARSVLCIPLRLKSKVIGALYLDKKMRGGGFSEDDLWALRAVAEPAAVALHDAELRSENLRKGRELEINRRKVQQLDEEMRHLLEKRRNVGRKKRRGPAGSRGDKREFRYDYDAIIGNSKALKEVFRVLDKVIDSDVPLLIQGESGTGKEIIAKAIHRNSPRKKKPFISQNCGAIPETLLESELFGYAKGAFTGAIKDTPGLFEVANGGVLFLDEVGDMSLEMQKRLLRVLEEGEVRRVGGKTQIQVDVRIVSASNRNLEHMKETGQFRQDLYYRINVVKIYLPALRERREDIPLLIEHFIEQKSREAGKHEKEISPSAMRALLNYSWQGNVRELENEVRRGLALGGEIITEQDLSPHITRGASQLFPILSEEMTLREVVEEVEKEILQRTLARYKWNKTRTSKALGLSRLGLRKKIERYGIRDNR